jgi:hypothetical protein
MFVLFVWFGLEMTCNLDYQDFARNTSGGYPLCACLRLSAQTLLAAIRSVLVDCGYPHKHFWRLSALCLSAAIRTNTSGGYPLCACGYPHKHFWRQSALWLSAAIRTNTSGGYAAPFL